MSSVSAPPSGGGGGSGSGSANILTEKVQRALQVRTDTPAMKAALDALAHLPANLSQVSASGGSGASAGGESKSNSDDNNNEEEEMFVVDSRSVRVAIEQDALQQALLLQNELKTLVDTVATLRQGVTDTAAIADRLYEGIHTDVTVSLQKPPEYQMLPKKESFEGAATSAAETTNDESSSGHNAATANSTTPTIWEESQLARTLYEAFQARDQAQQRLTVVQAFLDKFDLSEEDSRLLDHYNFEDVSITETERPINGMAFLKALQRVVQIRQALSDTFGPTSVTNTTGYSSGNNSTGSSSDEKQQTGLGTSSALRMMESLAQKQEQAYERLYHWLQHYLQLHPQQQQHDANQTPEEDRLDEVLSHPFCQLALQTLQHVPAFYAHTLELIANARRSHATRYFLLALTSGVHGMHPLEMKAHDAVVYVGDMLAFCFRAFSIEADFAKQMKTLQQKKTATAVISEQDNAYDDNEGDASQHSSNELDIILETSPSLQPAITAQETLALTMSGIARPLKSRIVQVIATLSRSMNESNEEGDGDDELESHDSMMDDFEDEGSAARKKVTQLYEICGLLLFYTNAMETVEQKLDSPPGQVSTRSMHVEDNGDDDDDNNKAKKETSPLMKAVLECLGEAASAYEAAFRVYAAMMDNLAVMSGHSEASLANRIVVSIADCRLASPGFSQDVPCPKEYRTTLSLDWSLEVILEASLNGCKTLDDALLLQQAIDKAKKAGLGESAAQTLAARVQEKESELIEALVSSETTQVLEMCGLGSMASAWKNFKEASAEGGALNSSMAAYPGLAPDEVQDSMKEFYSSLYSPPLPSLESSIKDPVLRKSARKKIAQRVCSFYSEVYQAILAEHESGAAGYEDVSFLGHAPDQVSTLFTA